MVTAGRGEDPVPYISQLFWLWIPHQLPPNRASSFYSGHLTISETALTQACDLLAVTCVTHMTVVTYVTDETCKTGSTGDTTGIPATLPFQPSALIQRPFDPHGKSQASAELDGVGGGWTVSPLSVTVSSIPAQPPTALL